MPGWCWIITVIIALSVFDLVLYAMFEIFIFWHIMGFVFNILGSFSGENPFEGGGGSSGGGGASDDW